MNSAKTIINSIFSYEFGVFEIRSAVKSLQHVLSIKRRTRALKALQDLNSLSHSAFDHHEWNHNYYHQIEFYIDTTKIVILRRYEAIFIHTEDRADTRPRDQASKDASYNQR